MKSVIFVMCLAPAGVLEMIAWRLNQISNKLLDVCEWAIREEK